MSEYKKAALFKHKSWSPDIQREEVWLKRRKKHFLRLAAERRSLSLLAAERRSLSLNADERRSMSLSADEHRSLSLNAADDRRRSMSGITNDDLDELRACFELGFGFDSDSDLNPKLTKAFPALELYQAVNKLSRSSSSVSTVTSDCETPSSVETSVSIVEPGDDQETVKKKLKQWAQVVALSVLPSPSIG
ncbi:uncharacterized protein LOC129887981 [Solanum dulcamara]|uniref:uncharacterized protein LOC129887981 n=1 Tax=Solanum dulcamara TaxID=45834 RepID=UPI002485BDCF|nr:uncharacterized protein LOC129887981 [Solanum dulcamara]